MPDAPPAQPRRARKVPQYDEYGNYLGDIRDDELRKMEETKQVQSPAIPSPRPPPLPVMREPILRSGHAVPTPRPLPSKRARTNATGPLLYCGADTTFLSHPSRCSYTTHSELELLLHRADRHLLYPPGGIDALRRIDPMRIAEERERLARTRKGGARGADGPADSTILGLNIRLDTPELVEEWIKQRRKRFPTSSVVQKKETKLQERTRLPVTVPQRDAQSESSNHDASESEGASSDSNSDMDPEADAISSKQELPAYPDERPVCRFWLHGACSYGQHCQNAHTDTPSPSHSRRRMHPRHTVSHPFQAPDLLRQLLEREILQHVDALAQLIYFLLDNDMLSNVEFAPGDAQQQRKRRARVAVVREDLSHEDKEDDTPSLAALPPTAPSPTLRALDELVWPEEPDPLIYLDPLRSTDPKPLRPSELLSLATDTRLRQILQPTSALHPHGEANVALRRSLESWAALPTPRHREAALQLMLGVSAHSPMHAHEAYAPLNPRSVPSVPHSSMRQNRVIGESELFRLGLRMAPNEVRLLQHIGERVAALTSGLEYA